MKKVLLIVIDALAARIVEPAVAVGRLPNMGRLIDAGRMYPQCTSIFPSITPAATCSIVTGRYPQDHGISGAYWYNQDCDEISYFGDDIWTILKKGIAEYIHDFQVELNVRRLRFPTIFERLEQHDSLRDACLNYLWFRGTIEHPVNKPFLFRLLPGVELEDTLCGPHILCLGDFVCSHLERDEPVRARGGITRRYGFHDETTADYLRYLASHGPLPEFTLAYFPNNDFESHDKGPHQAEPALQAFDSLLGELFDIFGGLKKMLDEVAILITGDHSQSDLVDDDAAVNLAPLLGDFNVVDAGSTWTSNDDVIACPNLRAAQIYCRPGAWERREELIGQLLSHSGIDQVIWTDEPESLGRIKQRRIRVATAGRGRLEFWLGEAGDARAADEYGGLWNWEGNLAVVDGRMTPDGIISFGDYPNAFERITAAFFDKTGHVWVTARLGYEFCLPGNGISNRGSHGSLHLLDSAAPLIAAGLPDGLELTRTPRTVDIVPLCMSVLDLERPEFGSSHCRLREDDPRS